MKFTTPIFFLVLILASCTGPNKQTDKKSSAAPFDYTIFNVPVLAQPSNNTCWATVTTMVVSRKAGRTLGIPVVLAEYGTNYLDIYKEDLKCNCRGLKPNEANTFFPAVGLTIEPPQSPTIQRWFDLMQKNDSPLIVVVGEKGNFPYYHAIVVTAFQGNGQPTGTTITYIDPDGGKENTLTMAKFIQWYEGASNWPGKGQILYFKK
ncbi:hypothetical protein D3C87_227090 [compost metagenome]